MVSRNNTPATRKRTRSQNDEEPSTAKKRRLKPSKESPRASPRESPRDGPDHVEGSPSRPGTTTTTLRRGRSQRAVSADKPVQPAQAKAAARAKKTQPPAPSQTASVYDVPDSGEDELTAAGLTPQPRRQKPGASGTAAAASQPATTAKGTETSRKRRGRPSKKDREAQAQAQDAAVSPAEAPAATTRDSPSGARQDETLASDGDETSELAQRAGRSRGAVKSRPGEGAQTPKGILTPRKRKLDGDRLRKSVAFDRTPDGEEPDHPAVETPSKSAARRRQAKTADEMQANGEHAEVQASEASDSSEDDEVCAICSKPDSEPPNEIVFCDNCDMAVHQECYGIAEIPEGDWFCRSCLQEDAPLANGNASDAKCMVAREDQRPDIPNFDEHLRLAQRVLLDRCAGRRRIRLRGQDEAYEKTYQLVEQTVAAGEGNSMMVIGARGCGKTTLVESVISDLSRSHRDQFHVVRLSGFIHTDDKLALREIWRQLGKEMAVEDELVNKTTNHADTMASLLALLSHPSEIVETQDGVTSRSIIFIIDEFDLFATHARQTLLYNLFDIAQARKAPIAVLGLTTRVDVVESLEKRVKSRFSHRYVYLSLPKSPPAYWDVCRQGLSIDEQDMIAEGIDPALEGHGAFWEWWNKQIDSLYRTQAFTDHLESHFHSTKSVSAFLTTCILPLAALSPAAPSLRIGASVSLEPPDSKLHLLGSLSDLDLSMLISAARLDIVAHTDTVNFAMAYDEYTSLMSKQRVQSASAGMLALGGGARVWGRGTAGIAWERLVSLGLLVPAAAGGRGTAGLGGLDAKMWKVDVALEEIPAAVKLNAVLARWCREI